MKKGIHYWALPTDLNLPQKLRFARDCGYDGAELALLKEGEFSSDCSREALKEIKRIAEGEGLELPSITNTLSWTCSFTSDRKRIRERAADTLKREINVAAEIGATAVLALPGFVSMRFSANQLHPATDTMDPEDYHPSNEIIDYSAAYERAVDGYRSMASYAEDAGIIICIENIWSDFLLSPLEMRSFLDDIGSKYVKAYFDVGNVYPYGVPEQWIRILGDRIERVHFKDYIRGVQSLNAFVPLLSGQIDFKSVMGALKEIGYDGWITAEVNVNPQVQGYVAQVTKKAMDEIFRLGGDA